MEGERVRHHHHHHHHHRSELFNCFTSRPSSMKTKSTIHSPGRPDKPTTLSTSLSRRLKNHGSIKGGQSPMFPATVSTTQRKKGGAFEPPEPSSPKVTCIGQVRVKTMKKNHHNNSNHLRSRSRRRGGEVSFRKGDMGETSKECLPSRNQRWVHLPLSICEALRAFGAELSCLFPSCGGERWGLCGRERGERRRKRRGFWVGGGSCGAALMRWVMAVEEEEKRVKEVGMVVEEVVVRGRREEEVVDVMKEDEGVMEVVEVVGDGEGEEEKRVSICIPPRNALLLMRCRSDPWKMSALASRFWGSPEEVEVCGGGGGGDEEEEEEEEEEDDDDDDDDGEDEDEEEVVDEETEEEEVGDEKEEEETERFEEERLDVWVEVTGEVENPDLVSLEQEMEKEKRDLDGGEEEQEEENECLHQALDEVENPEGEAEMEESIDGPPLQEGGTQKLKQKRKLKWWWKKKKKKKKQRRPKLDFPRSPQREEPAEAEAAAQVDQITEKAPTFHENPEAEEAEEANAEETQSKENKEEKNPSRSSVSTASAPPPLQDDPTETNEEEQTQNHSTEDTHNDDGDGEEEEEEEEEEGAMLPECLLLMMWEPKLSMEVSKETWVKSTDFIRPRRRVPSIKPPVNSDPPPPAAPPPPRAAAGIVEGDGGGAEAGERVGVRAVRADEVQVGADEVVG
ncbi:hypothetical protein QJS10_CPA01g02050 [Acorus calamus]|uniref:Uncharacterized protein n=1 Tax=Acorus calamus TaxID=4465 RepID=A0AAV9FFC1_ACOCL|nr:hypothetical protein QJS10_CPA01g02050 [Acorus calamus]